MNPLPSKSTLSDDPSRLRPSDANLPIVSLPDIAKPSDVSRPASTAPPNTDSAKITSDFLSDKATAAFIRRTLCAHHALSGPGGERGRSTPKPVDELLPPLTSSNEVDLQLYAIIAVVLKEFVYTWYAKITPDHAFVDQVIQIIAHCTRALEQRLRKVDLESLLVDEIPQLVDAHLEAFRIAHESTYSQPPLASAPREIYHILNPHPALSPVPRDDDPSTVLEQQLNEEAWRQLLVQGVLAVLLPTEDLENACLRALVAEIVSEMILGNAVSQKVCEPWFLWDAITTVIHASQPRTAVPETRNDETKPLQTTASRLEQFGLLSAESQQNGADGSNSNRQRSNAASTASGLFWMAVQYIFLASRALWIIAQALATSSSLPSRSKTWLAVANSYSPPQSERREGASSKSHAESASNVMASNQRPILDMGVWPMISNLMELNVRMPWLSGMLALVHHGAVYGPGKVADTDGAIDRLLSNGIHRYMLNASYVPKTLQIARAALFPNNAPGPARKVPDAVEIVAIKRKCAEAVAGVLPLAVGARFFGVGSSDFSHVSGTERSTSFKASGEIGASEDAEIRERVVAEIDGLLGVLGDAYMNKHLIFGIISLVVLRAAPELGGKGVGELMRERIPDVEDY
ncbi:hypothetical protein FKW77_009569 [Venturia effusa]|uniref:PXA domain-containing protein n=1 Tax=Venturia effusa TaxID=50376 RepID=A0A517LEL9_9PEZI|nr:hypothetical protein FKW77_009569 [Venturia effusa]